MKSLFKVTLLASMTALALGTAPVFAEQKPAEKTAEAGQKEAAAKPASAAKFKNDDEQTSYALGASFGHYMDNSLKEQSKLGIHLDRAAVLAGIQEAYENKSKLDEKEIEITLQALGEKMKQKALEKRAEEAKENTEKGDKFRESFAKEEGVKKTESGLLYKVEKAGEGDALKDTDSVVVHYKGSLVDNTEFDNSFTRGEPWTSRLDGVIPGWTEGLKHIRKGGKIKLVIPPSLAYGESGVPGSIPPNSTLIFDVELLDINPKSKAEEAKPGSGTAQQDKAKKVQQDKIKEESKTEHSH